MKRFSILFVAGIMALLLQATLFSYLPWGSLKPDLLLIVVIYLGFFLLPTEGGILAFSLGYFGDLFSGHLMGLFAFTRVSAWLISKLASGLLDLKSVPAQTIFVALYTVLDSFIMIGALRLFGGADYPRPELGGLVWRQALVNAVAAPFVITALLRIERRLNTSGERKSLELLP